MIISDTLNQPKALGICAVLGIIFGLYYALNYFVCLFLVKNALFRHIMQTVYVLIYGVTFFVVTTIAFNYDLKIYHIVICLFSTALTSLLIYLPINKKKQSIAAKCDALRSKLAKNKLVQRLKR